PDGCAAAHPPHARRRCVGSRTGGVVRCSRGGRGGGCTARRLARSADPAPRRILTLGSARAGASPRLWAIVGATGSGKGGLALDLAGRLRGLGNPAGIVNADAMQLYRGMDIGTAKLWTHERRGIPHHLLDAREVTDE